MNAAGEIITEVGAVRQVKRLENQAQLTLFPEIYGLCNPRIELKEILTAQGVKGHHDTGVGGQASSLGCYAGMSEGGKIAVVRGWHNGMSGGVSGADPKHILAGGRADPNCKIGATSKPHGRLTMPLAAM